MITGKVVKDKLTKKLIHRISRGQIALIAHRDLDVIMARRLLECGVSAVINVQPFISGDFPHRGPQLLLEEGVELLAAGNDLWNALASGDIIKIIDGLIYHQEKIIGSCVQVDLDFLESRFGWAQKKFSRQLEDFFDNTLQNALLEKDNFVKNNYLLPEVDFCSQEVLVVVRGRNYRQDLAVISDYIQQKEPVIIAVDGGADGCLEKGIKPDIIIGDMDSASDDSLLCGAQIIVHAYQDGRAPGLERINKLGLESSLITVPGTSEDAALLLAYEKGAETILALGTHFSVIDFLEKGRAGMGSTILVRMKIGHRLIDLKGISGVLSSAVEYDFYE